ncbi:hypothetical protein ACP70R_041027 [Stipagrostis hirtigluma subsp. patula]
MVCKQAGFGVSLFKRLIVLGFKKHLLTMQYRMNPSINSFPNSQFYEGRITDGSNVKCPSYNKDYLDLPFGSYTFLNIVDGKEERTGCRNSWRNMIEVAVVLHLIQKIFKCYILKPLCSVTFHTPFDAIKYVGILVISQSLWCSDSVS